MNISTDPRTKHKGEDDTEWMGRLNVRLVVVVKKSTPTYPGLAKAFWADASRQTSQISQGITP